MALQNRIASCDICSSQSIELLANAGWPGWAIIKGIGAVAPKPNEPLRSENTETYLCPGCSSATSAFLTKLQETKQ